MADGRDGGAVVTLHAPCVHDLHLIEVGVAGGGGGVGVVQLCCRAQQLVGAGLGTGPVHLILHRAVHGLPLDIGLAGGGQEVRGHRGSAGLVARILGIAAGADAVLIIVAQGLHRYAVLGDLILAAGIAEELAAGAAGIVFLAALGRAGGSLGGMPRDGVAAAGDGLGFGIGVFHAVENHRSRIGTQTVLAAGGRRCDGAGHLCRHGLPVP